MQPFLQYVMHPSITPGQQCIFVIHKSTIVNMPLLCASFPCPLLLPPCSLPSIGIALWISCDWLFPLPPWLDGWFLCFTAIPLISGICSSVWILLCSFSVLLLAPCGGPKILVFVFGSSLDCLLFVFTWFVDVHCLRLHYWLPSHRDKQ